MELHIFTHADVGNATKAMGFVVAASYSFCCAFGEEAGAVPVVVWVDVSGDNARRQYLDRLTAAGFDARPCSGLADGYCQAVETGSSKYLFMLEHDWSFQGERIKHSLSAITGLMGRDGIHHMRFNKRPNAVCGWDHTLTEVAGELPYCLTPNKSNNPHIIDREAYLPLCGTVLDKTARGSLGVEERLFGSPNIVSAIYGGLGWPATIRHAGAGRDTRLAVAIIVKNEAQLIAACLERVKSADEIVVVDTGSTDNTCDVIRSLGLPNLRLSEGEYKWNDHFAEARNFALGKTSMPWVLSIDADNLLEPGGVRKARELVDRAERGNFDAVYYYVQSGNGKCRHKLPWLFKRSCHWTYRVHNVLNCRRPMESNLSITAGYSPAHRKDPDRALRMLTKQLEELPDDPRTMYYLAREHWYRRDYAMAVPLFDRCAKTTRWDAERADALLYVARCLWAQRKGAQARAACLTAIGVNPQFREAARFMAEMSWPKDKAVWLAMANAGNNAGVLFVRD